MLQARRCRRCGPVPFRKERPLGARCARYLCVRCGGPTRPIRKSQPKAERPEWRRLRDRADDLWAELVRRRAGGRCQRCGKARPLQAAHNIGRAQCLATRHDPDNGLGLCAGCHMLIDREAEEKRALFLRHLGAERYERLLLVRRTRAKVDLSLVVVQLGIQLRRSA